MSKPSKIKPFSENTFNPVNVLATGVSVGLHVLLWVVQPALPSGSTSANNSRTVGFVQLTPEELSRLPEYSLPQLKLPPLPPPQATNILPLLPPVQSYTALPPVPVTPTYIPPVTQIPASPNSLPKSGSDINTRSRSVQSATDKPTNLSLKEPSPLPSQQQTQNSRRTGNFSPNLPANEEPKGLIRESVDKVLNGQNSPIQTENDPNSGNQNEALNPLPGGVKPGMVPGNTGDRQSENRNTTANNSRGNADRASSSPNGFLQNSVREAEILSAYGYSLTDTAEKDAIVNLRYWLDKIQQSVTNLSITRFPDTILVKSPINVKLPRVSEANVAVLLDPNGKIVGEPELIRSTGYSKLNEAAIAEIKKRSFPKNNEKEYKIYMYQLEIDQNALPPASGSSSNS